MSFPGLRQNHLIISSPNNSPLKKGSANSIASETKIIDTAKQTFSLKESSTRASSEETAVGLSFSASPSISPQRERLSDTFRATYPGLEGAYPLYSSFRLEGALEVQYKGQAYLFPQTKSAIPSSNNEFLAITSLEGKVAIYDMTTKLQTPLEAKDLGEPNDILISDDGSHVLTFDRDGFLLLFERSDKAFVQISKLQAEDITHYTYSIEEKELFYVKDNTIYSHKIKVNQHGVVTSSQNPIQSLEISKDGEFLEFDIANEVSKQIRIKKDVKPTQKKSFLGCLKPQKAKALKKDTQDSPSYSFRSSRSLHTPPPLLSPASPNLNSFQLPGVYRNSISEKSDLSISQKTSAFSVSFDGKRDVTVFDNQKIRIRDQMAEKTYAVDFETADTEKVSVSNHGPFLLIQKKEGTAIIYNWETQEKRSFGSDEEKITKIEFCPDQNNVACQYESALVQIYDLQKMKPIIVLAGAESVCFLKKQKAFLKIGADGVSIQNLTDGKEKNLSSIKNQCSTFALSPNEKYLALGFQDGSITMLNLTNREIENLSSITPQKPRKIEFSSKGDFLVMSTDKGNFYSWDLREKKEMNQRLESIGLHQNTAFLVSKNSVYAYFKKESIENPQKALTDEVLKATAITSIRANDFNQSLPPPPLKGDEQDLFQFQDQIYAALIKDVMAQPFHDKLTELYKESNEILESHAPHRYQEIKKRAVQSWEIASRIAIANQKIPPLLPFSDEPTALLSYHEKLIQSIKAWTMPEKKIGPKIQLRSLRDYLSPKKSIHTSSGHPSFPLIYENPLDEELEESFTTSLSLESKIRECKHEEKILYKINLETGRLEEKIKMKGLISNVEMSPGKHELFVRTTEGIERLPLPMGT